MDFSASALAASLLVSSIGLGLFVYGKRQQRFPQLLSGLALMIFPYFTGGALVTLGAAIAILACTWLASRAGW